MRRDRGFALVAAVILVALILVGLVGALTLGVRRLDATRTEATRNLLPQAFRGIFPHGVGQPGEATLPNLFTDFGYRPDTPTAFLRAGDGTRSWDLRALVDRSQVGVSDAAFATPPSVFDGGNAGSSWNGPYWRGALDGMGRPVDAWGRFLELRHVTSPSPGWILHSPGANGRDETVADDGAPGGDDLVYPSPPYEPPSAVIPFTTFNAYLSLVFVLRNPTPCGGGNNVNLTVVVTYQDASGTQTYTPVSGVQLHRNGRGKPNVSYDLFRYLTLRSSPPGSPASLEIAVTGGCPDTLINPVDFQPASWSGLTYLGSSTAGATTTYSFSVSPVTPPAVAFPWPITIQP